MSRLTGCFWLFLLLTPRAPAYDFTALKPQGYLSDFAQVVDRQSREVLERYCAVVERQTGAQIALVTLHSLEGEPVEDVANALFRKWGVGQKGTNEGILLLLSIQDRRSRLEVGYGLEPIIPDGYAGSILRAMRPALQQGHYSAALLEAAHSIGSRIAEAKGVQLAEQIPQRARRPSGEGASIPWPAIIGAVILLFWIVGAGGGSRRRRFGGYQRGGGGFLPGLILGNILGHATRGRHGGGGFGGFDSFDGFGGFGGGDSGGGGASSSW
jgi:uncharacterized protein